MTITEDFPLANSLFCLFVCLFPFTLQLHSTSVSSDVSGGFKIGMKLEALDRKNPTMTSIATITDIKDGRLLIHFDGWTNKYDYWCEPTTPDIHPRGWCHSNGVKLHPPKGKG